MLRCLIFLLYNIYFIIFWYVQSPTFFQFTAKLIPKKIKRFHALKTLELIQHTENSLFHMSLKTRSKSEKARKSVLIYFKFALPKMNKSWFEMQYIQSCDKISKPHINCWLF